MSRQLSRHAQVGRGAFEILPSLRRQAGEYVARRVDVLAAVDADACRRRATLRARSNPARAEPS